MVNVNKDKDNNGAFQDFVAKERIVLTFQQQKLIDVMGKNVQSILNAHLTYVLETIYAFQKDHSHLFSQFIFFLFSLVELF